MKLRKEYKEHDYLINTYGSFTEARNDKAHVDERRYAGILKLTADGTLIMGIWSLIKGYMETLSDMGSELIAGGIPVLIAIFGSVFCVTEASFPLCLCFRRKPVLPFRCLILSLTETA